MAPTVRGHLLPIERGVSIPITGYRQSGRYPWRYMKVGDSFMVERPENEITRAWNSLTSAKHWATYKTGFQFTMRRQLGGIRVWRIA